LPTNIVLSKKFSALKDKPKLIILTDELKDSKKLKKAGVDFVLVPQLIAAKKVDIILDDLKKGNTFELNWLSEI
jgi:Trk K+ transport system NAD-binding subunit